MATLQTGGEGHALIPETPATGPQAAAPGAGCGGAHDEVASAAAGHAQQPPDLLGEPAGAAALPGHGERQPPAKRSVRRYLHRRRARCSGR